MFTQHQVERIVNHACQYIGQHPSYAIAAIVFGGLAWAVYFTFCGNYNRGM